MEEKKREERMREREEGKREREKKREREREEGNRQLLPLISDILTVDVRQAES